VDRAVRLQKTREPSGISVHANDPDVAIPPLVRWAAFQSVLLCLVALVLLSPLLRVRTVVWTGSVPVPDGRYRAVEAASLGRPLALLPERFLHQLLGVDPASVRVALKRHPPGTLEVCMLPRHAVARSEDGVPFDARGRRLDSRHATPGLPVVVGFQHSEASACIREEDAALVASVLAALALPGLAPTRIELQGAELLMTLRGTTRVRAHATRLEMELRKLALFEHSLGTAEMPPSIDLRYRDQVVVRPSAEEVPRVPG
jgi:hypothetical protein